MVPARAAVEGPRLFPGIAAEYVRPERARGADQESAARLLGFVDRRPIEADLPQRAFVPPEPDRRVRPLHARDRLNALLHRIARPR